jgi:hypothetical protein
VGAYIGLRKIVPDFSHWPEEIPTMIYSLASIAFTIGLLLAWSMCRLAALADSGQNQPIAPYPQGDTSPRTTDYPDSEKGAVRSPGMAL